MIKFSTGIKVTALGAVVVFLFAQMRWSSAAIAQNSGPNEQPNEASSDRERVYQPFMLEHSQQLTLEQSQQLTLELTRRLFDDEDIGGVRFANVTELKPEVAAVLSGFRGAIELPAINQLTPEVAKALVSKDLDISDSRYKWLVLDGLKELSPEVARELVAAKSCLKLGIEKVTPEVSEILSTHPGDLALGLTSISPEVAEKLAKRKGRLSLDWLQSLDAESAAQLVKYKGELTLLRLESPTPEVLDIMSEFEGESLAINSGYNRAQAYHYLGNMLLNGEGVPSDYSEAHKIWLKAAKLGNATAQATVGGRHREGSTVPKDDIEAYAWLSIAAATALVDGAVIDGEAEIYASWRDEAENKLSPEAKTRGQQRAAELLKELKVSQQAAAK